MIDREAYQKKLELFKDQQLIKVITGVRRCGKSTLLEAFQTRLKQNDGVSDDQIIFMNFEDPQYTENLDWRSIYNDINSMLLPDAINYIFLDEVQNVPNFEKLADGLFIKKNVDLYITGSNAYFLSGELATILSGRYVEIPMLPLSFKEYVSAFEDKSDLVLKFENYLSYGSFPQTVELFLHSPGIISDYLRGIYNTVVIKDVMARLGVRNLSAVESVTQFMFDNIGNVTSLKKIADTMTSYGRKISNHSVEAYVSALSSAFILYPVSRYDIKGKRALELKAKYYVVDTGLRKAILGKESSADLGHLLENVIYLELIRRGCRVWVGKTSTGEIDFVTQNAEGETEYYQVSATVRSPKTLARELAPLDSIKDHNAKYLITLDPEEPSWNGIRQINALNFLL